ncbi:MAG: 3-methyl-2-oxobutanoate dehydrogenase subunit beta, partial [Chloroflexota bacterium]|nr:3-methyl-2-oxobutanoate dehydrogenase subunit beta [Chloroflexota bacterium]
GTAARVAKGAIKRLRAEGLPIGLFRPISLWPFPAVALRERAERIKQFFVFEMSTGQMVEDVHLALKGAAGVVFHGRPGGVVPTPAELTNVISRQYQNGKAR